MTIEETNEYWDGAIRAELKRAYKTACNAYLKAFCEKHGYDYETCYWIGDDVGGVAEVADYCIGIDTIREDIDQNAPEEEFVTWYDYVMRLSCLLSLVGESGTPNYRSWLNGCPRKSEEWFEGAERMRDNVERMRQELEECIRNENEKF